MELILDIINKIIMWFKNFFRRKKKKQKKELETKKRIDALSKKQAKNMIVKMDDDKGDLSIGKMYSKANKETVSVVLRKIEELEKQILASDINEELKQAEVESLNKVITAINNKEINVKQALAIENKVDKLIKGNEISADKIDNLNETIKKELENKDEEKIVHEVEEKFHKANYVLCTSRLIEDYFDELRHLEEDMKLNHHDDYYYRDEIRRLQDRFGLLYDVYASPEIQSDLRYLKDDFISFKNDKYSLLTGSDVFNELQEKCRLLNEEREKGKIKPKPEVKKKEVKPLKKEEKPKEEVKKEVKDPFQEWREKILKRLQDMELANLILQEHDMQERNMKDQFINGLIDEYYAYLGGEKREFNFDRNKTKTEIANLYNDVTRRLCSLDKKEFIPLNHINLRLDEIAQLTLDNKHVLEERIIIDRKVDLSRDPSSIAVEKSLTSTLDKEFERNIGPRTPGAKVYMLKK